jgi:hypothetical protein
MVKRPDLREVKVADRTPDNWSCLSEVLPLGEEGLDFYHAVEHLNSCRTGHTPCSWHVDVI